MSEIKKIRTMSWSLEYKLLYMGVGMEMEILTCNSVCVGLSQHVYKPSEKKELFFLLAKVYIVLLQFYTMPEGHFSFKEALTAVMNGVTWKE